MHCALPFCSISANIVALDEVQGTCDSLFQIAVRKTFFEEGFELESSRPNLQLEREIQDSIGWFLELQGFQAAWESLQLFLEWADRHRIRVDLSLDPDRWPATPNTFRALGQRFIT